MSGYIISLLSVSLVTGIIISLIGSGAFHSSLKMLCALTVLLTMLNVFSPLLKSVSNIIISVPETEPPPEFDIGDEAVMEETGRYIGIYTKDLINAKYGVQKEKFSVNVTLSADNTGNVSIKSVTVIFTESVETDLNQISSFVSDTLMCECIILTP